MESDPEGLELYNAVVLTPNSLSEVTSISAVFKLPKLNRIIRI